MNSKSGAKRVRAPESPEYDQRPSNGLTVSNPPPSHAPCSHLPSTRTFLAKAFF
jgi:hypothetical protein